MLAADSAYRASLGSYYGPNGAGYRAFDDSTLPRSRR